MHDSAPVDHQEAPLQFDGFVRAGDGLDGIHGQQAIAQPLLAGTFDDAQRGLEAAGSGQVAA